MKKLVLFLVLGATAVTVQSQNFQWAFKVGGASSQLAFDVATDGSGNIITTGSFSGAADFDPGTGTLSLVPNGSTDAFVAKYDANKNLQWAKKIGSAVESDNSYTTAVDTSGNVFIGGDFGGTMDLDPGTGTANVICAGFLDGFVVKLDAAGNYQWGFAISGADFFDQIRAMATDASGNLYIAGYYQGTVDFDPGATTSNLTTGISSTDLFFAKYDATGNLVWAKNVGGASTNFAAYDMDLDASGNILITGMFDGAADFNPGSGTALLTSLGDDIFVAKYDNGGNYIWAKRIGSSDVDEPQTIITDANNNVYISGSFYSTVDFNPGAATANLTSIGQADIFFASYDAGGNYRWANRFGSTAPTFDEIGYDLAVSDSGFIYLSGIYRNTIDIDPGASIVNLVTNGQTDMFLAKFDALGNYQSAFTIGSTGLDFANAIVLDNLGNVYLAGAFTTTCDFDPSSGTANLTATGTDMFLAKYGVGSVTIIENSFSTHFVIYPNPVNDELTIQALKLVAGDEIKILDMLGQEIYAEKISSETAIYKIQTANFKAGIFFLNINTRNSIYTTKFSKN